MSVSSLCLYSFPCFSDALHLTYLIHVWPILHSYRLLIDVYEVMIIYSNNVHYLMVRPNTHIILLPWMTFRKVFHDHVLHSSTLANDLVFVEQVMLPFQTWICLSNYFLFIFVYSSSWHRATATCCPHMDLRCSFNLLGTSARVKLHSIF